MNITLIPHFKDLPWWINYYYFCSHTQSLVELESAIVATTPYFEHTAPLTYSLCVIHYAAYWVREPLYSLVLQELQESAKKILNLRISIGKSRKCRWLQEFFKSVTDKWQLTNCINMVKNPKASGLLSVTSVVEFCGRESTGSRF